MGSWEPSLQYLCFNCYRGEFSQTKCDARRKWVEGVTGSNLSALDGWWGPNAKFDEEYLVGNIEASIGTIRIPVGVIGPIHIHGRHTEGVYMVPAATTEGALLASANRGSKALNMSGGVHAYAYRQRMQCTPVIYCDDAAQAERLDMWIKDAIPRIREVIGSVSRKARLITINSLQDAEVSLIFFSLKGDRITSTRHISFFGVWASSKPKSVLMNTIKSFFIAHLVYFE